MADWNFPLTGGGAEYGINEAGIATFTSGMDKALAREAIQNSLDAKEDPSKPVMVRFVKFDIDKTELPGVQKLEDILGKAKIYYDLDIKANKFYDEALRVIQGPIPCLRICDYNTKGLQGNYDQREKSTFYSLTIAQGVSNKSDTSGGAFGIGKSAPFTMSSLRTVFYSTFNIDNEYKLLGAARLTTFEDSHNEKRQNVGFYGTYNEDKRRVDELTNYDDMPEKFRRDSSSGAGSNITIVGYKAEENWKASILKAVLNNFYPAIHFNNLIVEIIDSAGEITVNSDTISDLMLEYASGSGDSQPYYQALTDYDYKFPTNLPIIGNCSLYVKKDELYPGQVQMARSPMMIVKSKRFGSPEAYAGLFICNDPVGDSLLRNLEPPAHEDWRARLWDPSTMEPKDKNYGYKILNELNSWIKEKIDEISSVDTADTLEIEGLGDYLPDDEVGDFESEDENDDLLEDRTKLLKKDVNKPIISKPPVSIVKPVKPGDKPSKPLGGGKKPKPGSGNGVEEDDGSDIKRILTSSIVTRSREVSRGAGREYVLNILPEEDTSGDLMIVAYGEIGHYETNLKYAKNRHGDELKIEGSMIKGLQLRKGVPELITLKLIDGGRYSVGVENYGE